MSTLRATNIKHESSATNQIVLGSDGSIGGTLGDTLAAKLDTSAYRPGLSLIAPTSIAYSGTGATSSAGTTSFTACTSVSVNGVFSAAYSNYLIVVDAAASASAYNSVLLRLRASGTDATGANYNHQRMSLYNATTNAGRVTSATGLSLGNTGTTRRNLFETTVFQPFVAVSTGFMTRNFANSDSGSTEAFVGFGDHTLSTSYDGLTIYTSTPTITGKLYVYGYSGA